MYRVLLAGIAAAGLSLAMAPTASAQPYSPAPYPERYNPYWRGESNHNWRAEQEIRTEEARREEWRRDHCVRDFYNHVYCR